MGQLLGHPGYGQDIYFKYPHATIKEKVWECAAKPEDSSKRFTIVLSKYEYNNKVAEIERECHFLGFRSTNFMEHQGDIFKCYVSNYDAEGERIKRAKWDLEAPISYDRIEAAQRLISRAMLEKSPPDVEHAVLNLRDLEAERVRREVAHNARMAAPPQDGAEEVTERRPLNPSDWAQL